MQLHQAEEDLTAYYESLIDMFATEGWKNLIQDYQEAFESMTEYSDYDCETNDKWQYRRGELQQMRNILHYEDMVKAAYDERNKIQ